MTAIRTALFVTLASTLAFAQGSAPPMPPGTNVLLGRVVETRSGSPVGGAMVTLVGHFDASGKPATPNPGAVGDGRGVPPALSVMTTPDGYFVFRNLPAGLFTTMTRAYGYLNSDFPPTVVEVRDSQTPTEVRLRVWKYAALAGRVVDERGEPLTGLPVSALRRVTSAGSTVLRRAATDVTDDRGQYRLAQLTPGDYVVAVVSTSTTLPESVAAAFDPSPANRDSFQAMRLELIQSGFFRTYGCPTCIGNSHEGHHYGGFVLQRPGAPLPPAPDGRPLGFANTYHPGTSRPDDATLISLASGEARAGVDLSVRLTPTVSVAGALTGPDGPMAHVALHLIPPGADPRDFEPAGIATAVTDHGGAFMFLAVTPGEYLLGSAVTLDFNERTGEARPMWTSQRLTVDDRDVASLAVTMQPGVPVSGRVEFRGASGVESRPSQRHIVFLEPVAAVSPRTLPVVVRPDGTFRSAGDPPGRYIVNATAPPGWFWQATSLDGKTLLDGVVDLGASEVSGLVLTFGQKTNRISGRVSTEAGGPDPEAAVVVFPADSTAWRQGLFTGRRTRKVHTTSAGTYEVASLAPGDYYVAAVSTTVALDWQDPRLLERLIAAATKVTLDEDDERALPLRTGLPSER